MYSSTGEAPLHEVLASAWCARNSTRNQAWPSTVRWRHPATPQRQWTAWSAQRHPATRPARWWCLSGRFIALVQSPAGPDESGHQGEHDHQSGGNDSHDQFAMRRGSLRSRHGCYSFISVRRSNPETVISPSSRTSTPLISPKTIVPKYPYCQRYGKDVLAICMFRMRLERPKWLGRCLNAASGHHRGIP